jgi:hypothetical protein
MKLINQALGAILLALSFAPSSSGGVDRVRVIVENNPAAPGEARIWFPHLRRWIKANPRGVIQLPAPYDHRDLITVEPKYTTIYGPRYTRLFPVDDGIVSLRAIPVTAGIKARAKLFAEADQPGEAAVAFALAARREELSGTGDAANHQRQAYVAIAQKYSVPSPYVKDGNEFHASPQLVAAINGKLGYVAVPTNGRFSIEDFQTAAGLKNLSPIVATVQEKHFASLEK